MGLFALSHSVFRHSRDYSITLFVLYLNRRASLLVLSYSVVEAHLL